MAKPYPSDTYQSKYRQVSTNDSTRTVQVSMKLADFSIDASLAASNEFDDMFLGGTHGTAPDLSQFIADNGAVELSPMNARFVKKRCLKR